MGDGVVGVIWFLFYRCTWAICIVFLFIFMACMISLSKFQLLVFFGGRGGSFFTRLDAIP